MLELLAAQTAWAGTAMGRAAAVEVEEPAYGLRLAVADAFFGGPFWPAARRLQPPARGAGGRTYSVPAICDADDLRRRPVKAGAQPLLLVLQAFLGQSAEAAMPSTSVVRSATSSSNRVLEPLDVEAST